MNRRRFGDVGRPCRWNKREDDFPLLDEFNDYLEEREDISALMMSATTNKPISEKPRVSTDIAKAFGNGTRAVTEKRKSATNVAIPASGVM